jgi:hypothetical protein
LESAEAVLNGRKEPPWNVDHDQACGFFGGSLCPASHALHQRIDGHMKSSHGALTQRTNRAIPTTPMQPPATAASHKTIASQGNVKQYRSAGVMTRTRR